MPAERLIKTRVAPPDTPFALVEKQKGAVRLVALSQAAHLLGLTPGLPLADARARVPDLPAFDHDRQADETLLARLADSCLRYTPRVMMDGCQGLILDVSGCQHLFDSNLIRGEKLLAKDLHRRLHEAGLTARLAFSVSADAALALAAFGLEEGEVKELPVTALRCDPAVHQALRRAGLRTIGDLASRPPAVLAARFGKGVTMLLARLLGEIDTPIIPRRSRPPVRCEARFAEPIGHSDSVRLVLTELAEDAVRQLEERGEGARKLEASLFRCDGAVARLAVETAAPVRDVPLIMRLFQERIDALADPLDPGFGYDQIGLAVASAEPLAAVQHAMDSKDAQVQEALAALLARLSTRLGPDRVTCWRHIDSHVPEGVFVDEAALSSPNGGGGPSEGWWRGTGGVSLPRKLRKTSACPSTSLAGSPPRSGEDRPLLLLNPPEAVDAIAQVPDGPPYRFRWRGAQHRVARHEGPERISMPWWDGRAKAARLTRDYYRVEDIEGRRFWLFRHGLYSEKTDPEWYLHGLFA